MISRLYAADSDNASLKRKRQIDTLKIFNANVTEVIADVEYHVEFSSGGHQMALRVMLGVEFPLEKPVLHVVPPVSHPWANEDGEIVGAPGLLSFTVHSDLGRVVQAIIREFEKNPPPLATSVSNPSSIPTGGAPVIPSTHAAVPQQLPPPPELSELQELLSGMSVTDLEELQKGGAVAEDRLTELVCDLPPLRRLEQLRSDLMSKIVTLAEENLAKQPTLKAAQEAVRAKTERVANMRSHFEALSAEHRQLAERYAPDNIREALQLAAQRSDEESDAIAEAFLNGEIDVERFTSQYIRVRMLSQERKTKEEKLYNQLKELQKAGF